MIPETGHDYKWVGGFRWMETVTFQLDFPEFKRVGFESSNS